VFNFNLALELIACLPRSFVIIPHEQDEGCEREREREKLTATTNPTQPNHCLDIFM
jgi:hypothetical protein